MSLLKALRGIIRLHELEITGNSGTPEEDQAYDLLDAAWCDLTDEEEDLVCKVSEALLVEHERVSQ